MDTPSPSYYSRTAAVSLAFTAGVLLTLGFKDFYPDLEARFRQRRRQVRSGQVATTVPEEVEVEEEEDQIVPASSADGAERLVVKRYPLTTATTTTSATAPGAGTTTTTAASRKKGGVSKKDDEGEIAQGIQGCIGQTPLFKVLSLSVATGCEILAKAEFLNGAGGSPKDRVALNIINMAEEQGLLTPHSGDMIYEGTVGSTGISLATLCRARGYLAYICMPSDQAKEKSDLLLKLGAVVERVPPAPIVDPMHFVNRARSLAAEHTADPSKPGRGFFADQFEIEANWKAHLEGTGPEIYHQCHGRLDAFVAGAGTGGTISGVARYMKARLPALKIVLADPQGSGLYNRIKYGVMFDPLEKEGTRRRHQVDSIVEGIGLNRVTANFEAGKDLIDDAVKVSDEEAIKMAKLLVEKDGIFVGSSSAVNCVAAVKVAQQLGPGHRIVTIMCDSGTRHLSKFWAKAGNVGGDDAMTLEDTFPSGAEKTG